MKKLVALLFSLLGFAALADSYTFTPGTVIPLKENGSQAAYVTKSGDMKVSSDVHVDSTKKDGTLTVNLTNSATGDYVLRMLGTADGYTSVYTLTVTDGSDYTRTVTVNQKNTKADTTLGNANLGDSNSTTVNAQPAFLVLDSLPQGALTLTFKIDSSTGNWAGNYGYFTIYEAASVPVLDVSSVSGTALYSLSSQNYISKCGTISYESNGVAFGSSKHGAVAAFALNVPAKASVTFEYDAGSKNSAGTSHKWVLLSNDSSSGVNQTTTYAIAQTSDWWGDGVAQHYSLDFGSLTAGYYTLCCYVVNSDTGVWAGNFGNFTFNYTESSDLDISADTTLTESSTISRKVTISNNPTIDLAGYDLVIDVSAGSSISGTAEITNTSSTLSTLTLKNLSNSTLLQGLKLRGNVKLVIDGFTSDIAFNSNSTITSDATFANTHTGGTWMQNFSAGRKITIDNTSSFGTGPVVFNGNVKLYYPNSGQGQNVNFANDIYVYNSANELEGVFGGNTGSVNFNGDWYGDGEIWMYNSWSPQIYVNNTSGHNNDNFTGRLLLTYNRDSSRGYHIGEYSTGFPNATVVLTNRYASADARTFQVYCQTRTGVVKFGRLSTDQVLTGDGYTQHTNTCLIANHGSAASPAVSALYIGAAQTSASDSDIFSGYLREQEGMTFSLTKEGAGSLTLNGQTASTISGGITVSGGTLVLNTTFTATPAITVKRGATLKGGSLNPSGVKLEPGATYIVSASSDTEAKVMAEVSDSSDYDASAYKVVATVTSTSGVWTVTVALDKDAVKVELSNTTWTADTANNQITFTIAPESLKAGLYYGVATGTTAGACTCSSYSPYDGTTAPTLTAALPNSGVMYYTIKVSDTGEADSAQ